MPECLLKRMLRIGNKFSSNYNLLYVLVCGEVGALRAVLAAGADAATSDQHGGYPLHYAAQMCGAPAATDHQVFLNLVPFTK